MHNLLSATARIERVTEKLDALKSLFKVSESTIDVGEQDFVFDKHVHLDTVFQNDNSAVSVVTYTKKEIGHPLHSHHDLIEYLIVTKGRFIFKGRDFIRIMDKGDCATIPAGLEHTTIPLDSDGELLAICIPPEKAYTKVKDSI